MAKTYHYTECGLDNVYLVNGFRLAADGSLYIEDIHGLHRHIGLCLVHQSRKLKGKEIRFIRHSMDLSQKGLGGFLGVDYQTVHRWETGRIRIPKTAETLLRVLFGECLDPDLKARTLIEHIADLDNDRKDRIELAHKKFWKEAA